MGHSLAFRRLVLLMTMLCVLAGMMNITAGAEETGEAEDITGLCTLIPASARNKFGRCTDGRYKTYWYSTSGKGAAITVTLPEGQGISGIWLQWYERPHGIAIQVQDQNGEWTECARSEGLYLSEYVEIQGQISSFRIANQEGNSKRMALSEIRIFGDGNRPEYVQVWNPPAEKADLMIIVAHPDDEVLWFGGMMPTYAGEQGKICQVCMMVPTVPWRRLELLDCLWTCGVRNYPAWAGFKDSFSLSLKGQYKAWSKKRVYEVITGWIRRFRPDVLATHDLNGEYGHGAHRVCADAVIHCLEYAADSRKYSISLKEYGVWDVPKCYIHLYSKNVIDMNWQVPLSAFGGKTSFEVAEEAFRCHVSQQSTDYRVRDEGDWDCSLFGLYRSLVGEDELKNDLFEHLN